MNICKIKHLSISQTSLSIEIEWKCSFGKGRNIITMKHNLSTALSSFPFRDKGRHSKEMKHNKNSNQKPKKSISTRILEISFAYLAKKLWLVYGRKYNFMHWNLRSILPALQNIKLESLPPKMQLKTLGKVNVLFSI